MKQTILFSSLLVFALCLFLPSQAPADISIHDFNK
jgi:hypothetical protein